MGHFLKSLSSSLTHVLSIANLTRAFDRFRVVAYHDHSDPVVTKWTPWCSSEDLDKIITFVKDLKASGGGDHPEAIKFALGELIVELRKERPEGDKPVSGTTLVYHMTDAPPHHEQTGSRNKIKEKPKMEKMGVPFDWIQLSKMLNEEKVIVYNLINNKAHDGYSFYPLLSYYTGGKTLYLKSTTPNSITQVTINLTLALLGSKSDLSQSELLAFETLERIGDIKDENKAEGYLPGTKQEKKLQVKLIAHPNPQLERIQVFVTPLKPLTKRFNTDSEYQNLVFETFKRLMNPQDILALTYNSVLGTFWRGICKRRDDIRREELLSKIDVVLRSLSEEDLKVVKAWLDQSYNQSEVVTETNRAIEKKNGTKYPMLVLEAKTNYAPQDILEIARSCQPSILAKVGELLTGLRLVQAPPNEEKKEFKEDQEDEEEEEDENALSYVCWDLSDKDLFSFLPHLMAKGCVFSLRPCFIMAALVLITNNKLLKERAEKFLKEVKGKWFDAEVPENYTVAFAKLVMKIPNVDEYLTAEEKNVFEKVTRMNGFTSNLPTEVSLLQTISPVKEKGPDHKLKCKKCNMKRSFTLMLQGDICGLCNIPELPNHGIDSPEPLGDEESYWAECRTCQVHYAVVRIKDLNVAPKCYHCRINQKAPFVKCTKCQDKFLVQTEGVVKDSLDYNCIKCQRGIKHNKEDELSVLNLIKDIKQNREIVLDSIGISLKNASTFNLQVNQSPFKAKDQFDLKEIPSVDWTNPQDKEKNQLVFKGKPILNSKEVLLSIYNWVKSGNVEEATCMLCFSDFPRAKLNVVCGHSNCKVVACFDCLEGWYGSTKLGGLVLPPRLSCPFCKRYPRGNVLSKFNRLACLLVHTFSQLDPNWYHGWCMDCYLPKPFVEHVCARDVPELAEGTFHCETCTEAKNAKKNLGVVYEWKVKTCPSCKMDVVKTSGCNHITCVCGEHWCYVCEKAFDYSVIYDHIWTCTDGEDIGDDEEDEYGEDY
eukprot:TRINITY_DN6626_c0_g1_i2.p1 TRINITY_DN6626_c0_g1~~TRINITY_DN6626_c0_g1_i2.p1  ORF type:complete len:991 (-),score=307.75 TRINITY_DN6626_c0_g1_i2:21-2993(-)